MLFSSRKFFRSTTQERPAHAGLSCVKQARAFTLVELLVSVGIFALMTALVVAKYGSFNNGVLLTNTAYDVALAIRTAQTYGLGVKSTGSGTLYDSGYGVYFNTSTGSNQTIILFSDLDKDSLYDIGTDGIVNQYTIKQGAIISKVCSGVDCSTDASPLAITFKRPNPDAIICFGTSPCNSPSTYAEITITSAGGDTRIITVRGNGQISVKN
jgi:Tfp pilus assembly protein FimT